jgi:hypothetical protein
LKFQEDVLSDLEGVFFSAKPIRGWLTTIDPHLSEIQLNVLEQTWGDIIVTVDDRYDPIFVECVTLKGEDSRFPESKVKKFNGDNKFYAFGWDGEVKFIPSSVWNADAKKLPRFHRKGRAFRKFSRKNITDIENGCLGPEKFRTQYCE